MKKLIIIHPKDESTAFLNPIWKGGALDYASEHQVINVGYSEDEHYAVFDILKNISPGSNVVYLGHGNSFSLKGACSTEFNLEVFFSKDNIGLFERINLLCLSCKSADFLRPFKELSYVAFGDLPTQMTEISGSREQEFDAYKGVDEQVVADFRQVIVSTIANAIYEWMTINLDSRALYHRIKIRLMREIGAILSSTEKGSKGKDALLDLLVDMRKELEFR